MSQSPGETLRRARVAADLTQAELAYRLGLSPEYISMIESDKRNITAAVREKLEVVLGVKIEPSHEVRPVVSRGAAVVPYYRHMIRAGKAAPDIEDDVEEFDVSEHYENTAVYEVSGDSMLGSGIEEGDRLVVRLGYKFKNRSVILCRYNGELMVKGAMIKDGTIWLIPANPHYKPWPCKEEDQFECIGTVVEVIKDSPVEWLRHFKIHEDA